MFNLLLAAATLVGASASLATLFTGAVSGWMIPVIGAFTLLLGYVGLYHLAGWRSMRRHRTSDRKASP